MIKVTKFYTQMCGPCKSYAPIFEKVKGMIPGVEFVSVDAHQHTDLTKKYGLKGVPATIFEKDGVEVNRLMGLVGENELINAIKSL